MKLNVPAFALTAGLLWGGAVLLVALANLAWPGYGRAFLDQYVRRNRWLAEQIGPGAGVG